MKVRTASPTLIAMGLCQVLWLDAAACAEFLEADPFNWLALGGLWFSSHEAADFLVTLFEHQIEQFFRPLPIDVFRSQAPIA